VEAFYQEDALETLSENGIVAETLKEDPVKLPPRDAPRGPIQAKGPNTGIEHALENASTLLPFDKLIGRYKPKTTWVVDREKILRNVRQVVDTAIAQSAAKAETEVACRARVAQAIEEMFGDSGKVASQVNSTMERQLFRMERLVLKVEAVLAAVAAAARSGGGWGGGGGDGHGQRRHQLTEPKNEQNAVLLEIFKENLKLRGIELDMTSADGGGNGDNGATDAPTPSTPPSAANHEETKNTNDLTQ